MQEIRRVRRHQVHGYNLEPWNGFVPDLAPGEHVDQDVNHPMDIAQLKEVENDGLTEITIQ